MAVDAVMSQRREREKDAKDADIRVLRELQDLSTRRRQAELESDRLKDDRVTERTNLNTTP